MRILFAFTAFIISLHAIHAQKSEAELLFSDSTNNADVLMSTGISFYQHQQYDSSIAYYLKGINSYNKDRDIMKLAVANRLIGVSYSFTGSNELALRAFQEAIDLCKQIPDSSAKLEMASLYGNLGMTYRALSNYSLAVDNLILALKIFEDLKDDKNIANTFNHLGNVFRDWKQMGKAEEYYLQAYRLSIEIKNQGLEASTLNNLAIISREKKDFDQAISYYKQSILLKEKLGNKRGIAASMLGLGITYKSMGQYDLSLDYYLKTLKIDREINDKSGEGAVLGNIGLLYSKKNMPAKALEYLTASNEIAQSIGYLELQKNNMEAIAEAYEMQGNFKQALQAEKRHHELQDSIFSIDNAKQIKEIEARYQTEKNLQELELLAMENELKDEQNESQSKMLRILIIMISLISISSITILSQYISKNKAYKLLVKKSMEISLNENFMKNTKDQRQISDGKMQQLIWDLEDYFRREKPYLQVDFQLQDCCKMLNTNSKYLSQAVNEMYQVNFTSMINELRIREATVLLSSFQNKNYTIEAIAQQVGFNSKSAFNTAFKKYTGVTPSYYIQNLHQIPFRD